MHRIRNLQYNFGGKYVLLPSSRSGSRLTFRHLLNSIHLRIKKIMAPLRKGLQLHPPVTFLCFVTTVKDFQMERLLSSNFCSQKGYLWAWYYDDFLIILTCLVSDDVKCFSRFFWLFGCVQTVLAGYIPRNVWYA